MRWRRRMIVNHAVTNNDPHMYLPPYIRQEDLPLQVRHEKACRFWRRSLKESACCSKKVSDENICNSTNKLKYGFSIKYSGLYWAGAQIPNGKWMVTIHKHMNVSRYYTSHLSASSSAEASFSFRPQRHKSHEERKAKNGSSDYSTCRAAADGKRVYPFVHQSMCKLIRSNGC